MRKIILFAIVIAMAEIAGATSSYAAEIIKFDGIGVVYASYHFDNDGSHAWRSPGQRYNEFNPGLTIFFKPEKNLVIDELGFTYILKNSYGVPSVYLSAYRKLFNAGPVQFDLAAALATGYHDKIKFADRFDGIIPVAGITMLVYRHFEVDVIPAGYFAGRDVANEIFFSLRFTGL